MNNYIEWFKKNKITEVECLIPDNSGIPRGKILPTKKFLSSFESGGLRLPLHLFKLAVSRSVSYSIDDQLLNPTDGDFILKPDFNTLPDFFRLCANPTCGVPLRYNSDSPGKRRFRLCHHFFRFTSGLNDRPDHHR